MFGYALKFQEYLNVFFIWGGENQNLVRKSKGLTSVPWRVSAQATLMCIFPRNLSQQQIFWGKNIYFKNGIYIWKISASHRESEWDPSEVTAKPVRVLSRHRSHSQLRPLTVPHRGACEAFRALSPREEPVRSWLSSRSGARSYSPLISLPQPRLRIPLASVFLATLGNSPPSFEDPITLNKLNPHTLLSFQFT